MTLEFYQVDAFSKEPFSGNPAVVYPLSQWLDEALMQQIAAEHNQAETAFVVKQGSAWHIRWFTPTTEVPLCGHATLASAHVLFDYCGQPGEHIEFIYAGGELRVSRKQELLELDFPAQKTTAIAAPEGLSEILGQTPLEVQDGSQLLVRLDSAAAVRACCPDLQALAQAPWCSALIITAPGEEVDFVSRNFAPAIGIDEDPVTGSAHCILTPYWAAQLGKNELSAYQGGSRGGYLWCQLQGSRVKIAGHARLVSRGQFFL